MSESSSRLYDARGMHMEAVITSALRPPVLRRSGSALLTEERSQRHPELFPRPTVDDEVERRFQRQQQDGDLAEDSEVGGNVGELGDAVDGRIHDVRSLTDECNHDDADQHHRHLVFLPHGCGVRPSYVARQVPRRSAYLNHEQYVQQQ